MKRRLRISLRTKFLFLSLPTVVMAVALAASTVIPFRRSNDHLAAARRSIAVVVATERAQTLSERAMWDVGESIAAGAIDPDVARDRADAREAFARWAALEPSSATRVLLNGISKAIGEIRPLDDELMRLAEQGHADIAMRRYWNETVPLFTHGIGTPLSRIITAKRAPTQSLFVGLAGEASSFSGILSDRVTKHLIIASASNQEVGLATEYRSDELTQARYLGAYVFGVEPDTNGIDSYGNRAVEAMSEWASVVRKAETDPIDQRELAALQRSKTRLDALIATVVKMRSTGDPAASRRAFTRIYAPALERHLSIADPMISDELDEIANEAAREKQTAGDLQLISIMVVGLLLAVALLSLLAATRISRRTRWLTSAAGLLGRGDLTARVPAGSPDELGDLARAFNAMGAGIAAANDRATGLLARTISTSEAERQNLAAELHDGPVQRLTAVLYDLERVTMRLDRGGVEVASELAAQAKTKLSNEVAALRHLMAELRPPALEERGLGAALDDYVNDFRSSQKIDCTAEISLPDRLDPAVETTVYRIVQQSLANVARHADARRVCVRAWTNRHALYVDVEDDGVGFDPTAVGSDDSTAHFGIHGMTERARMAGGRLTIDSKPGSGARVRVTFPIGMRLAS